MRKRTISSYVGYAIKSRNVVFGVDNIIKKSCCLVLYDQQLGSSSLDKLLRYLEKRNIKGYCVCVEDFYPNKNCKALAITEKNLATAIIKEMEVDTNA